MEKKLEIQQPCCASREAHLSTKPRPWKAEGKARERLAEGLTLTLHVRLSDSTSRPICDRLRDEAWRVPRSSTSSSGRDAARRGDSCQAPAARPVADCAGHTAGRKPPRLPWLHRPQELPAPCPRALVTVEWPQRSRGRVGVTGLMSDRHLSVPDMCPVLAALSTRSREPPTAPER